MGACQTTQHSMNNTMKMSFRPSLMLLFMIIVTGCFKPGYQTYPKKMLRQLEKSTTSAEVRSWVAQVCATNTFRTNFSIPPPEWPPWLRQLKVRHALQDGAKFEVSTEKTNVSIFWGDGRGTCGLIIDFPTNTPCRFRSYEAFTVYWEPGIYTWYSRRD